MASTLINFLLSHICFTTRYPVWGTPGPNAHYQVIIMTLYLKVNQSHYTSLKMRIYIQIDQCLCIFSCTVSIFFFFFDYQILSPCIFSAVSPYSSLTSKPRSQSIASCPSWILKGQLTSVRYCLCSWRQQVVESHQLASEQGPHFLLFSQERRGARREGQASRMWREGRQMPGHSEIKDTTSYTQGQALSSQCYQRTCGAGPANHTTVNRPSTSS